MRHLDRYVIRETVPPFLLALGIFTFVLAVRPMLDSAQALLAKNVPLPTVGLLLVLLLPSALGLTIPMAFLSGLLMGFGRLSGDRETVAFLACGVSPLRLLRPVIVMALVAAGIDLYVMINLLPDANQKYRDVTYSLLVQQTQSDIKPRIFYTGFPGKVLYVLARTLDGGWSGVMVADTSQPERPTLDLAESGEVLLDSVKRQVTIVLSHDTRYVPGEQPDTYDTSQVESEEVIVTADSVFGNANPPRGVREMSIADLKARIAELRKMGQIPSQEEIALHQKFSFPVACIVFALLGLALGLHTRKEGKLAGMVLGLGVITVYYALMAVAEARTKGHLFPPEWARWVPNLALAPVGLAAVWWRNRAVGSGLRLSLPGWLLRWRDQRPRRPPQPKSPAVVIRLPYFSLPLVRTLDRYVAGRYLRVVSLAFLGLLGLYYIGTVIDLSEKLFKGQATTITLIEYLWYSTPQFISYVIPVATLVAVLGTIGGLTRTSELTVMRACGVSLYRTAAPLLALAIVGSAVLFGVEETVLAPANRESRELGEVIRGTANAGSMLAGRSWFAGPDGRLYYYAAFDQSQRVLYGLSVFNTVLGPYRLTAHTYAARAVYEGPRRAWQASDGWTQRFSGPARVSKRETFHTRLLAALPSPSDFGSAQVSADEMTFTQLRDYIRRIGHSGFSVAEQQVSLQGKVAFPLVTVVMTLIGVPFAVTTGRRGALYGIGIAIGLAVTYWLLMTVFLAAGTAGLLPPILAAWAANVLFVAGAAFLTLTVRT